MSNNPNELSDDLKFKNDIAGFSSEGQFLAWRIREIHQRCGPCLEPIKKDIAELKEQMKRRNALTRVAPVFHRRDFTLGAGAGSGTVIVIYGLLKVLLAKYGIII